MPTSTQPMRGVPPDIQTAQHKRETERLQVLDSLACVVATASDPVAIATAAAGLLQAYFGPVRCVFANLDGESRSPAIDGIPLARFGAETTGRLSRGETVASGDGINTRGLPVRSFLLCPHMAGGALAGLTAVLSAVPLAWSGADRAFLSELSRRAWTHMGRLELIDALREADRRKEATLASLAHELRGPLTVACNSLALLGRPGAGMPPQAVLTLMERQLGHMTRMLADALDTSCQGHPPGALQCRQLDLKDAVLAAVEAARVVAPGNTHTLALAMPAHPIPVRADPTRLAQALGNVLANALKFARVPASILVEVKRQGAQALVRIADNGIGMSPWTLARLTALFGSELADTPLPAGGLGIGLWIAWRVIKAHGGAMRVESRGPDLGSTLTITLPVQTRQWRRSENK